MNESKGQSFRLQSDMNRPVNSRHLSCGSEGEGQAETQWWQKGTKDEKLTGNLLKWPSSQQLVCFWPPCQRKHTFMFIFFYVCLSLAVQARKHTVSSGTSGRRRRMDITAAGSRPAVHPMSGSAGRAPKSAPERPSLTHRSTSWSAASTRSGTSRGPNGPNWRSLWDSRRLRWKSGSRTGDIKPNGATWRPSFRNQRKSRWRCWWGTVRRTITRRVDYTSHWLCLRTRASSTTRTCTTGASRGAWTACRVEGCAEAPSERLKVLAAVLDDGNFGDCTVLFPTLVVVHLKSRASVASLFLSLKQDSFRARPALWGSEM